MPFCWGNQVINRMEEPNFVKKKNNNKSHTTYLCIERSLGESMAECFIGPLLGEWGWDYC